MDVIITKQTKEDWIEIRRKNRPTVTTRFPKKGPVPHDAVHYFVETAIGLKKGFWGLVAAGIDPEAVQDMAKAGGHASAKRASSPDDGLIELLQAERLVECFEAALWSEAWDPDGIRSAWSAGCAASHVATLSLEDSTIAAISADVQALAAQWQAAPAGHHFAFQWSE